MKRTVTRRDYGCTQENSQPQQGENRSAQGMQNHGPTALSPQRRHSGLATTPLASRVLKCRRKNFAYKVPFSSAGRKLSLQLAGEPPSGTACSPQAAELAFSFQIFLWSCGDSPAANSKNPPTQFPIPLSETSA